MKPDRLPAARAPIAPRRLRPSRLRRPALLTALLLSLAMQFPAAQAAQAAQDRGPLLVLQRAHWVAEGSTKPRHILYVFVDANCPFCHKFWLTQQRYYREGLQVRSLLVDVIARTSAGKAAAILAARDPVAALRTNELHWGSRPDGGGGIAPVALPGAPERQILAHDDALMQAFGFQGTPALVWFDAQGRAHGFEGAADSEQLGAIVQQATAPR